MTAKRNLSGTINGRIVRCDKISRQSRKVVRSVAKESRLVGREQHRDFREVFLTQRGVQQVFPRLL